jgi:hypothetical protein
MEISNFFLVSDQDKYGNKTMLSEELGDYGQSLLRDVYKYYETNPIKSIKRLWMYLAFRGKICELLIFDSLFLSAIALYSQVLTDIEVGIRLLLFGGSNFNSKLLLESLNSRLKLLNGLCVNDYIYHNVSSSDFPTVTVQNLKVLHNCLRDKIKMMTYKWLDSNNIDIFKLC